MEYVKLALLLFISLFLIEYKFNVNLTASLDRMQVSAVVKLYKLKIVTILFLKTLKIRILYFKFKDFSEFKATKGDVKENDKKNDKKNDVKNFNNKNFNKNKNKDNTKFNKILKILPEIKINKVSQLGSIGFNDSMLSGFSCGGFMGVMTFIDCVTGGNSVFIPSWEDEFSLALKVRLGITPINVIVGLIA